VIPVTFSELVDDFFQFPDVLPELPGLVCFLL
jgi:hypothetical protein